MKKILLCFLCITNCFAMPSHHHKHRKKIEKKTVAAPKNIHHKIIHTESLEEEIIQDAPVPKKKKKALRILMHILTFGITALIGTCK